MIATWTLKALLVDLSIALGVTIYADQVTTVKSNYGTLVAFFGCPEVAATEDALQTQHVIGLSRCCRLRKVETKRQCYRCYEFGHIATNCRGKDRSSRCHRSEMPCLQGPGCNRTLVRPAQLPPSRRRENNGNWVADPTGNVAAVSTGRYPIQRIIENRRYRFVVVDMRGIVFCSVYLPPVGPDSTVEDFRRKWTEIASVIPRNRDTVIGGDVNAWSRAWGMERRSNDGERVHRGAVVMDAAASLGLVLLNRGNHPTWSGHSGRSSIVDVSFCSPSLMGDNDWRVCDENPSDHNTIKFTVERTTAQQNLGQREQQTAECRWATRFFNKDLFVEVMGSL
ncbi:uncharacterized protein LOC128309203, partial [Anopheles moucheti]|uniref:uncharacterized protein LOC128309203 n=1 Tax=Anopheles moucheti TaxID=186751 RepID=UPI0022F106CA